MSDRVSVYLFDLIPVSVSITYIQHIKIGFHSQHSRSHIVRRVIHHLATYPVYIKMQVAIVVILLSVCASLALPVPLDKSDQRREDREEREISAEELERELEDIENRISSVRTKVKEESKENKENLETTKGTPPTSSTKTSVERKTDIEVQTTAVNVKTTEGVHIIVEKETSPTHTSKPTEPTPTPKKQDTKTKISATPVSTEKTPFIVKVEVEQEQKTSGAEKKLQEEVLKSESLLPGASATVDQPLWCWPRLFWGVACNIFA